MTGLEKILAGIQEEASREAEEVLASANAKADEILQAAQKQIDEKNARTAETTAQEVQNIEAARDSQATLQRRQSILQTKQTLLAQTLDDALQNLYTLPDDQYFAIVAHLAAEAAEPGSGVILLNAKDTARLPANFMQRLTAALPSGVSLTLADETRPIDGGCILKYGDIELNCSFAAIFDARRDELYDLVREVLFA